MTIRFEGSWICRLEKQKRVMVNAVAKSLSKLIFICVLSLTSFTLSRASELDLGSADARFEKSELVVVARVVTLDANTCSAEVRIRATLKGATLKKIRIVDNPLASRLAANVRSKPDHSICSLKVATTYAFMLVRAKQSAHFFPTSLYQSVVLVE
jgi:hypothetical protein